MNTSDLEQIIESILNSSNNDAAELIFEWDDEVLPELYNKFHTVGRATLHDIWHEAIEIWIKQITEEAQL